MENNTYLRLISFLDSHKAKYRLIDHPKEGKTEIVSKYRGNSLSQAAKCMVLRVNIGKKDTKYVLGVIPGDRQIDFNAVKELLHASYVSFAPQEITEKLAQSVVGTVLPFSFSPDLELIVDPSLLIHEELFFNAARLDRSMALKTKDYVAMAKPRLAEIAKSLSVQENITTYDKEITNLRHSCAHLLAAAVIELWPLAKRTIGPAIENGFYYDFDFGDIKVSEIDFPKIESKMHDVVKTWNDFQRKDVNKKEALELFKHNEYKKELIEDFTNEGQSLTLYQSGNYVDLCRGGHCDIPNKQLKYFKLLNIAGAYWRGSEKNKMLTRIYGTYWQTKKELDHYLWQLEEAKKRDHRKLGKELELFLVSEDVGPGLILWQPKGYIIKDTIEQWAKDTENAWGYQHVSTPNITKSNLYYTSGHLPYYRKDMYPPMKLDDGEEYYLKPMNCPHHHQIFKARPRSYRELPLRYAEYGTCYRYEGAGELFGLMRVRGFSQNDAHIYCSQEQAVDEFVSVMKLHEYYYKTLGITNYHLELALRDPKKKEKYHGNEEMWLLAEKLMREAVKKINIAMVEDAGNAAFYGPKIDFIIQSSIGREFAISTNQIDLYMGKRFGLTYIDKDGIEKTPVIIHRAPLGSHERFIGFLIEHFGGAFPLWLAPVQVVIIPISERHTEAASSIVQQLKLAGLRVEIDDKNETMQGKIRNHTLQKVPYLGIIGDRETQTNTVSVRKRSGEDLKALAIADLISRLQNEIESKS